MNTKNGFLFALTAVGLVFVGSADAQSFIGGFAVGDFPPTPNMSAYTSSSMTLDSINLITGSPSGTFATYVPSLGDLTAYSSTISGLSATPLAVPITDFFMFSTPDSRFGSSGTTPNNRFDFNLATLTESSSGVFTGTGTFVDSLGTLTATPGEFNLSFSGANNYSFTIAVVPEPATISLVALGLLGAAMLRGRKS